MEKDKVFNNFREYYSLTKSLQDYQKEIIFNCLSVSEQKYLSRAFKKEGWEDLFIRNEIDAIIDEIEENFEINLIMLRIKVVSNKEAHKIGRSVWEYINDTFSKYSLHHIWHLFEGIRAVDHTDDWVLLIPSEQKHGEKAKPDDR